jgi:hypothetical protein
MAELLHGSHPCGVPPPSHGDLRPARPSIATAAIRAPGIRMAFRLMLSGRTRSSDDEIPPGHLPLRTFIVRDHTRTWELRTRPAQPQCQNAKMTERAPPTPPAGQLSDAALARRSTAHSSGPEGGSGQAGVPGRAPLAENVQCRVQSKVS